MKTSVRLLIALAAISVASQTFAQTVLAKWTFEGSTTPADLNNSISSPTVSASTGTGTASGLHASSATDWSTPTGNGSAESFSVNTWAAGDYFQFTTSTSGYESIAVSWDQQGSATGPRDFKLQYSINGTTYTDFASYSVITASPSWSATVAQTGTATNFTQNLSSISSLTSITAVYFRLTAVGSTAINSSPVAAGGTSRIDNFTITGTAITAAIPEPSTYAAIFGAVALAGVALRRRQQAKAGKGSAV